MMPNEKRQLETKIREELVRARALRGETTKFLESLHRIANILYSSPVAVVGSIIGGALGILFGFWLSATVSIFPLLVAVPCATIIFAGFGLLVGKGPQAIRLEMRIQEAKKLQEFLDVELRKAKSEKDQKRIEAIGSEKAKNIELLGLLHSQKARSGVGKTTGAKKIEGPKT
jgi:hypothetical protein